MSDNPRSLQDIIAPSLSRADKMYIKRWTLGLISSNAGDVIKTMKKRGLLKKFKGHYKLTWKAQSYGQTCLRVHQDKQSERRSSGDGERGSDGDNRSRLAGTVPD